MVLLAWHGGNAEPLARAVARLRGEGRRVACWQPSHAGGDSHAGRIETSLMLAIAPELVGGARPVGTTEPLAHADARVARGTASRRRRRTACSATPAAPRRRRAARCCASSPRTSSTFVDAARPAPARGMSRADAPPADLEVCLEPSVRVIGARPDPHGRLAVPDAARHRGRRRSDRSLEPSGADRRPGRLPRARPPAAGRRHARPAARGRPRPRRELTVVVPVRDRAAQLERCLDAVRAGCPDSPVVVVDDGSADPAAMRAVCDARGARVVRRPVSRGAAAARNAGLAACATAVRRLRRLRRRAAAVGAVASCSGTSRIRASPPSRRASARCSRAAA